MLFLQFGFENLYHWRSFEATEQLQTLQMIIWTLSQIHVWKDKRGKTQCVEVKTEEKLDITKKLSVSDYTLYTHLSKYGKVHWAQSGAHIHTVSLVRSRFITRTRSQLCGGSRCHSQLITSGRVDHPVWRAMRHTWLEKQRDQQAAGGGGTGDGTEKDAE